MPTLKKIARSRFSTIIIAAITMVAPALLLLLATDLGPIHATCFGGIITIVLASLWRRWQAPVLQETQPTSSQEHPLVPITLLVTSAFLVAMTANSLTQALEKTHNDQTEQALAGTSVPLIFFTVIVIAPLAEELVFRGMIHNHLRGRSVILATVTSAVAFGASHGNPTQAISGVMLGLILSCVYEMTGTLIGPILSHMGYNLLVLVAPGLGGSTLSTTIILSTTGIVTISSVAYLLRRKKNQDKKEDPIEPTADAL